jgi:hypothetical protein
MGRVFLVCGLTLLVAACGQIDAVYLKHPTTGRVVQCGPYTGVTGYTHTGTVLQQRGCIEDYRAQGYERVPSPN